MRLCSQATSFVNESHLPLLKSFETPQEKGKRKGDGLYNNNKSQREELAIPFASLHCIIIYYSLIFKLKQLINYEPLILTHLILILIL